MADPVSIANDRFGLGARPDRAVPVDVRGFLFEQLAGFDPAPSAFVDRPSLGSLANGIVQQAEFRRMRRAGEMDEQEARQAVQALASQDRRATLDLGTERLAFSVSTEAPFPERLVHFWSNHFAVSIERLPMRAFGCDYEFGAIRSNIMGSFTDLVIAAVSHPAMLIFLDQTRSIGPQSPVASRVNRRLGANGIGLNENLARELLELHTLGVRSGYSQNDVTELAKALTGWTIAGLGNDRLTRFVEGRPGETTFAPALHEPGARTILGRTYPDTGPDQARSIIADLALHPATARHIATKLAVHFIADDPPLAAIERLERAFLQSHGDLPTVYAALIEEPEIWAAERSKFRTPWDWLVALLRVTRGDGLANRSTVRLLDMLGQPLWRPGHPAGWGDTVNDWASPGALLTRVEIANRLATGPARSVDAIAVADSVLGEALRPSTRDAIAANEGERGIGLAMLLSSPEFLRR